MPRVSPPEPVAHLTWDQVLAFRLNRQFLEPLTGKGAVEITRRLCGVQAQVASAAEFAIAVRRRASKPGAVARAIRARSLVKTWAMRGTLHLLPASEATTYLGSLARLQPWRARSWERYHGVTAAEVEDVIDVLSDVLHEEPVTREELKAEIAARVHSKAAREKVASGWGELLKPAAWAGVLLQGPPRGAEVTFVRADAWIEGWRLPDPDAAGEAVLRSYLRAHGPATLAQFGGWWARQQPGKVRLWFERLGEELALVDIEGEQAWAMARDVPAIGRMEPSETIRLLGNFDQYVLGSGSGSAAFIPPEHRAKVSRTAGWISKVVMSGGRVVGVWEANKDSGRIEVEAWESLPERELKAEIERVGDLRPGASR